MTIFSNSVPIKVDTVYSHSLYFSESYDETDLVKGRSGERSLYLTLAFVAMLMIQTRMNVLNDSILKINTDFLNDSLRKGSEM